MTSYNSLPALFTAIADAIRARSGDSSSIVAADFPTAISAMPTGLTLASPVTAQRSGNLTIAFSDLAAEPQFFVLSAAGFANTSSGDWRVALVIYDGTNTEGASVYYRSDQASWQIQTTYTKSWNSGTNTLTVTAPTGRQFVSGLDYSLVYAY